MDDNNFHEKMRDYGWISLELEKPPNVTPVLVIARCCTVCLSYTIAEYDEGNWFKSDSGGESLNFKPEYYKPLPPPIKRRNASYYY